MTIKYRSNGNSEVHAVSATIASMKIDLKVIREREEWQKALNLITGAQRWIRQYEHEDPGHGCYTAG